MTARLEIAAAHRTFRGRHHEQIVALDGVDFTAEPGRRIGVIGESGSGKSTLVRMLLGLDTPTTGTARFRGADISTMKRADVLRYRREVQLVAQDTSSSFDPLRSLRSSVRRPAIDLLGLPKAKADEAVDRVLTSLTIDPRLAERRPGAVSGGQRQRFAIARALIVEPQILVCDESVSALDVSVQGSVLNEIKRYCEDSGAGLVFVSHGVPATAFISTELAVMHRGRIVDRGTTDDLVLRSQHPYTRTLLDAYLALAGETLEPTA